MKPYCFALLMFCTGAVAAARDAVAQEDAALPDGTGFETADELPALNRAHADADVAPLALPAAGNPMKIYRERRDPGSVVRQLEDYRECMIRVRGPASAADNAAIDPRETCRSTLAEVEQRISPQLRQALVSGRTVESSAAREP